MVLGKDPIRQYRTVAVADQSHLLFINESHANDVVYSGEDVFHVLIVAVLVLDGILDIVLIEMFLPMDTPSPIRVPSGLSQWM